MSLVRGIVLGSGGGSGASGGASGVVHGPLHTRMLAGSPQVLSMGFCACTSSGPASVILLLQPRGTAPCIHCWDASVSEPGKGRGDDNEDEGYPPWIVLVSSYELGIRLRREEESCAGNRGVRRWLQANQVGYCLPPQAD